MKNHLESNRQKVIGPVDDYAAGFPYGNSTLTVSVNIYEKEGKKSLAKVSFSAKQKSPALKIGAFYRRNYDIIPSDLLVAYYQNFWADVDKALFMQRETILEK